MTDTAGSDVEQAAREYARDAFPLVPAARLFRVAGERITDFIMSCDSDTPGLYKPVSQQTERGE
jgi:hypothetical protein